MTASNSNSTSYSISLNYPAGRMVSNFWYSNAYSQIHETESEGLSNSMNRNYSLTSSEASYVIYTTSYIYSN